MQNKYKYEQISITKDNVNKYYTIFAHTKFGNQTISTQLYNLGLPLVFTYPMDARKYISDFGLDDENTQCLVAIASNIGKAILCTHIGFKLYSEKINNFLSTSKNASILGEYCVWIGANYISIQFIDAEFELSYDLYEEKFMYYSHEKVARDSEDMLAIVHLMESLNDIVCEA